MVPLVAPVIMRASALLICGVKCQCGIGSLLAAARRFKVDRCTASDVCGLLGVGRQCGQHLSLMVVYLDCYIVISGNAV